MSEPVTPAPSEQTEPRPRPAYVLVRSDDVDAGASLGEYVRSVDRVLEQYGARILVQNFPARVVEGTWTGFVTLLEFADLAAATRWYDSPEYQAIVDLRRSSSTPTAIIVEGVAPGHASADLAEMFGLP